MIWLTVMKDVPKEDPGTAEEVLAPMEPEDPKEDGPREAQEDRREGDLREGVLRGDAPRKDIHVIMTEDRETQDAVRADRSPRAAR